MSQRSKLRCSVTDPAIESAEGAITYARLEELRVNPVRGNFDAAHLKEVHRRIFQDLPHHGPGEFRPETAGYVKARRLEATGERHHVHYAPRKWIDERLDTTLADVQAGKALRGLDPDAFARRMAKLYGDLDFLHPFREGNSRTLRAFTSQLTKEAGYTLDWTWSGADAQSRDQLYKARDKEVTRRAFPGLDQARAGSTENRAEYEAYVFVLARYRDSPELKTLVRDATYREQDLRAASTFREVAASEGFAAPTNVERLQAAAAAHPPLSAAFGAMRQAELFAREKFADSSQREAFFVSVRERIAKDLSRGKEIVELVRDVDKQRER